MGTEVLDLRAVPTAGGAPVTLGTQVDPTSIGFDPDGVHAAFASGQGKTTPTWSLSSRPSPGARPRSWRRGSTRAVPASPPT